MNSRRALTFALITGAMVARGNDLSVSIPDDLVRRIMSELGIGKDEVGPTVIAAVVWALDHYGESRGK